MEFLGRNIEFGPTTLKKSFTDFKTELNFLVKDLPTDQAEEQMIKLYKDVTGRDPNFTDPPNKNKNKTQTE